MLSRGLNVLFELSVEGPLSVGEVAVRTRIPKSSVYRILCILEEHEYVHRRKIDLEDFWSLDLSFLALSANLLGRIDIKTEIRDVLELLADDTKEIVQLAIYREGKIIIIDNVKKYTSLVNVAHEGTALPINTCVAGFVFGAFVERLEIVRALGATELLKRTEYTITDPDELLDQFELVQKQGYAVDDQYYAIGHRCIGAPVFDHTGRIVAEINISGHIHTITDDRIAELAAKVRQRASLASRRLGFKAGAQ